MQEAQQAGPSSGVIGARALTGVNHDLEEGQSLTGSEYSGSFNGSVTTLASHSYTTGYRTSFAGTDAGSDAGSYVSQSQGLKRSMSRCVRTTKYDLHIPSDCDAKFQEGAVPRRLANVGLSMLAIANEHNVHIQVSQQGRLQPGTARKLCMCFQG